MSKNFQVFLRCFAAWLSCKIASGDEERPVEDRAKAIYSFVVSETSGKPADNPSTTA